MESLARSNRTGQRIRLLPRVDPSEVPTDSDRTQSDVPFEPPTVEEPVRRRRLPEPEHPPRKLHKVTVVAVVLTVVVIVAAALFSR